MEMELEFIRLENRFPVEGEHDIEEGSLMDTLVIEGIASAEAGLRNHLIIPAAS